MLLVARTNAIDHALGLHHIFLAKKLVRLLAPGVGAQHFAGNSCGVLLRRTTRHGFHLHELSGLVGLGIFGKSRRSQRHNNTQHQLRAHFSHPQKVVEPMEIEAARSSLPPSEYFSMSWRENTDGKSN